MLAGGIAHDFNNLLHVILGNAEIALSRLAGRSLARQPLEEVIRATIRAADLARQMFAYSGKGALVVRNLDLSNEVREMATLLRPPSASGHSGLGTGNGSSCGKGRRHPDPANRDEPDHQCLGCAAGRGGTMTLRTGVLNPSQFNDPGFGSVIGRPSLRPTAE